MNYFCMEWPSGWSVVPGHLKLANGKAIVTVKAAPRPGTGTGAAGTTAELPAALPPPGDASTSRGRALLAPTTPPTTTKPTTKPTATRAASAASSSAAATPSPAPPPAPINAWELVVVKGVVEGEVVADDAHADAIAAGKAKIPKGIPPLFTGGGLRLSAAFEMIEGRASIDKFVLTGDVRVASGSEDDPSRAYFQIVGRAVVPYPCEAGDDVEASVTVSALIGALKINRPGVEAKLLYHCKAFPDELTATTTPPPGERRKIFQVSVKPLDASVSNYVSNYALEDFAMTFDGMRSVADTPENAAAIEGNAFDDVEWRWDFQGSVRGKTRAKIGEADHGVSVTFGAATFPPPGRWTLSASYAYDHPPLSLKLAVSDASSDGFDCDAADAPTDTSVEGVVELELAKTEGKIRATASGTHTCREDTPEWDLHFIVDEATFALGDGAGTATLREFNVTMRSEKIAKAETDAAAPTPTPTPMPTPTPKPKPIAAADESSGGKRTLLALGDAEKRTTVVPATTPTTPDVDAEEYDWEFRAVGGGSIDFPAEAGFIREFISDVDLDVKAHVKSGAFSVEEATVNGMFTFTNNALALAGKVTIRAPCVPDGPPLAEGEVRMNFVDGPLNVENAVAEVKYFCGGATGDAAASTEGVLKASAKIDEVKIKTKDEPVTLKNVDFDVTGSEGAAGAADGKSSWTYSGSVAGEMETIAGGIKTTTRVAFFFDTAPPKYWALGVVFSLHTDGVDMMLRGRLQQPCDPEKPNMLEGDVEIHLEHQIAFAATMRAQHWCDPAPANRFIAEAKLEHPISAFDGKLDIEDARVLWKAMPNADGSQKDGTALAKLRQEGTIFGKVSAAPIEYPGVSLVIDASVEVKIAYSPAGESATPAGEGDGGDDADASVVVAPVPASNSKLKLDGTSVKIKAALEVMGTAKAGQKPMLTANLEGVAKPFDDVPVTLNGDGVIRFPGKSAGDAPSELNMKFAAEFYGEHLPKSVSKGKSATFTASMQMGSSSKGGSTIYGFKITRMSAVGTLYGALGGKSGRGANAIGLAELSAGGDDAAVSALGIGRDARAGSVVAEANTATSTPSITAPTLPALSFDMQDLNGEITFRGDVELTAQQRVDAVESEPAGGLDASVAVIWKGVLAREPGRNSEWRVTSGELAFSVAIAYETPQLSIDLRAEGNTACREDADPWRLQGSVKVPRLKVDTIAEATYACATRKVEAKLRVPSVNIETGGLTLKIDDVKVDFKGTVTRFPVESARGIATGTTSADASKGETAMDWTLELSGAISIQTGDAGMPMIDGSATVSALVSNVNATGVASDANATKRAALLTTGDASAPPFEYREVSVDVHFEYALNGVEIVADASYDYPCRDAAEGSATISFDEEKTGIAVAPVKAAVSVPCGGGASDDPNADATIFMIVKGEIQNLRLTDAIVVDGVFVTVTGRRAPDGGGKTWTVELKTTAGINAEAAAAALAPSPSPAFVFDMDATLSIATPAPDARERATPSFAVNAKGMATYASEHATIVAVGAFHFGACAEAPTPTRADMSGNVKLTLPSVKTPLELTATVAVKCVDDSTEFYRALDVVDPIDAPRRETEDAIEALTASAREEYSYAAPVEKGTFTEVKVAGTLKEPMDIVEGVMRAMTLTADVVMIFPEAENAGLVKTRFRGKCAGAGELVGELPNADAMRLKGSALTFEVHFATDDRGALQLGKFKITLTVEIKYYMSGGGGAIPMSTPAAPPARTSGATGPANLGGEEIAGDLGETVGVARAAVAASTPPDTPPNIYLKSFATLQYPCGLDETQNMDAELAIRFGRVNVENVRAKFVYHCARVGPKLPAFTLVADVGCDDTAEGCKGTDAVEIVPNVLIRNFNVEIKGKFIDGATEYVGKLKGQIAHASASLAFGFDFNTQLGMYGIVTAIVFENEYVKATLDARLRVGGDCGATASASATPGPAALGAAARVRGLVAHLGEKTGMTPEDFQSPADAAPDAMNTLSGKIAMKLPGMTEMTVSVNGHTKCDVEDAREPMVDVVGSMGDVAVAISEDYKLVVKRTGVSLRGYKKRHGAKGASDFKLATPDDFKELSYRVKVRGTLSLTQSTGLPELGAGYDQTDRDEEATEEELAAARGESASSKSSSSTPPAPDAVVVGADLGSETGAYAMATVVATFDGDAAPKVDSAVIQAAMRYAAGPPEAPIFEIAGALEFNYPCAAGVSVHVDATMSFHYLSVVNVDDLVASATVPCGRASAEVPVATVHLTLAQLKVQHVLVSDVDLSADVFQTSGGFGIIGTITASAKSSDAAAAAALGHELWGDHVSSLGHTHASLNAHVASLGDFDATVTFEFNTIQNTFKVAASMRIDVGPLKGTISVALTSAEECDPVDGDHIVGIGTLAVGDGESDVTISGVKNCGVAYAKKMRADPNNEPVAVAPAYHAALRRMLAPVGAANQHPKCVDDSGLCGPDFGGRVCDAGRYCVGGMCRYDIESEEARATAPEPPPSPLAPPAPAAPTLLPSDRQPDDLLTSQIPVVDANGRVDDSALAPRTKQCCHGEGKGSEGIVANSNRCCDQKTLLVTTGKQCSATNKWCDSGTPGSCLVSIPEDRRCAASSAALGAPVPDHHPYDRGARHRRFIASLGGGGTSKSDDDHDHDAAAADHHYPQFSNNFAGSCGRCSADDKCGPDHGNTICPGNRVCIGAGARKGTCVVESAKDPMPSTVLDAMFRFSNNYGYHCVAPPCAHDGKCGPDNGEKVCPAGETCKPNGECEGAKKAAALGVGSSDDALLASYSNNHLNACPKRAATCAMNQLCGPENGMQVCMSGQTCVSGRCVMNYVFESKNYPSEDVQPRYSDNAKGACNKCAGGHRAACGGDKKLRCPGTLRCAVPKVSPNATAIAADARSNVDHSGLVKPKPKPSSEANSFKDLTSKTGASARGATFGDAVCLTPEEIAEMKIAPAEIATHPDDAENDDACDRPELVAVPEFISRVVYKDTFAAVPPAAPMDHVVVIKEKDPDHPGREIDVPHRRYVIACATPKPGLKTPEGAPCGRLGAFAETVCPPTFRCVDGAAAARVGAADLAAYTPRPKNVCLADDKDVKAHELYEYPNADDPGRATDLCDAESMIAKKWIARTSKSVASHEAKDAAADHVGETMTYDQLFEPCGPTHGGLVCSDAKMSCAAMAGVCLPTIEAITGQYDLLREYSANFGAFASETTAAAIAKKRAEANVARVDAVVNMDGVAVRDFPAYELKVELAEASFLGGKVKLAGVVFDAYGAYVNEADDKAWVASQNAAAETPTPPTTTTPTPKSTSSKVAALGGDFDDLHWDGEMTGAIVMSTSNAGGALPRIEGSFFVTSAWAKPPRGKYEMRGLLAEGEVRAAFGGDAKAPRVTIKAKAAFPVPCKKEFAFPASGSLVMRNLGGGVNGVMKMAATYYCGEQPDARIADYSAKLTEPIEIAGMLTLKHMDVVGTLFRTLGGEQDAEDGPPSKNVDPVALEEARVASSLANASSVPTAAKPLASDVAKSKASLAARARSADGEDAVDDETGVRDKMQGKRSSRYYTKGVIKGEVSILSRLKGLAIAAAVNFDTSLGAAEVVAAIRFKRDEVFAFDARARIPIGYCDDAGTRMIGTVMVNAAPFDAINVHGTMVRHCEGATRATEKHGHVWRVRVAADRLEAFDGALVAKQLTLTVTGKQTAPEDAGLSWFLDAEGAIELGKPANAANPRAPSMLSKVRAEASFKAGVSLSTRTLSYFDVNATADFRVGFDKLTNSPKIAMRANMRFSYPCTAPFTAKATGSINHLGGKAGLSVADLAVDLVFYCDAGVSERQMSFVTTVRGATMNSQEVDLEIAASAFNILDPDALPIETGALNRGDGEAERWYWKGTIKASAGIVLSKSAEANFGSQLFFNTAVHPLKLIAVVKLTIETDAVKIQVEGETSTTCEDSGSELTGSLTVKKGANLPFKMPVISVAMTKTCKPYAAAVYSLTANLSPEEVESLNEGYTSPASEQPASKEPAPAKMTPTPTKPTTKPTPTTPTKPTPTPSTKATPTTRRLLSTHAHPASPVDSYAIMMSVPASTDVYGVVEALHDDLATFGASDAAPATTTTTRHDSSTVRVHGVSAETWRRAMHDVFHRELSSRLGADPARVRVVPSATSDGDVQLAIRVRGVTTVLAPSRRAHEISHSHRLDVRGFLGPDYGVAGALSRAAALADAPAAPTFASGHHASAIHVVTRCNGTRTAEAYAPSPKLRAFFTSGYGLDADADVHVDRVFGAAASAPAPALGASSAIARLGDDDAADAMKMNSLIVTLRGRKIAASDPDDAAHLAWEFDVNGKFEFKRDAGAGAASIVPAFIPRDASLEVSYVSAWNGAELAKKLERSPRGGDPGNCATEASPACGAGKRVCAFGFACVSNRCVEASAMDGGDRVKIISKDNEDYVADKSFNHAHACTKADDPSLKEASALAVKGHLAWASADGKMTLAGDAAFTIPCAAGDKRTVELTMDMDKFGFLLTGVKVKVTMPCLGGVVKKRDLVLQVDANLETMRFWDYEISGLRLELKGFAKGNMAPGAAAGFDDLYFQGSVDARNVNVDVDVSKVASSLLDLAGTISFDQLDETNPVKFSVQGRFVKKIGDAKITLVGSGLIAPTCTNVGDFTITGEATIEGIEMLGTVTGSSTFESDCGDLFRVKTLLTWPNGEKYEHLAFDGVSVNPKALSGDRNAGAFSLVVEHLTAAATSVAFELPIGTRSTLKGAFNALPKLDSFDVSFDVSAGPLCAAAEELLRAIPILGARVDLCEPLTAKLRELGAEDADANALTFEKLNVRIANAPGKAAYFVGYLEGLNVFGETKLDVGMLLRKPSGKALQYAFFLEMNGMTKSTVPVEISPVARKVIKEVIGDDGSMKAIRLVYSSFAFLTPPGPAEKVFERQKLFDVQPGFELQVEFDLASADDEKSKKMKETMVQSSSGEGTAFDANMARNAGDDELNNFVVGVPFSSTKICLTHAFKMKNPITGELGIPMGDGVRFMMFKPMVCGNLGPSPSVSVAIKAVQHVDVWEGTPMERVRGVANKRKICAELLFSVAIDPVGVAFRAKAVAKVCEEEGSPFVLNPGGSMSKGGLVFPLSFGTGFKVLYSGVGSTIDFIEFEAGVFACSRAYALDASDAATTTATKTKTTKTTTTTRARARLGSGGDDAVADAPSSNADESPTAEDFATAMAESTAPRADVRCVDDPYGEAPLMITIKLHVDVQSAAVAFAAQFRKVSFGRVLYVLAASKPKPDGKKGVIDRALGVIAPIFDMVKFDNLVASVNTMPFPVKMNGGDEIPGGVYFLLEKFNFLGIVKAKKVMVHVNPLAGSIDVQLFVDPIKLEVAGVVLLEVRGVNQEDKYTARAHIDKMNADRAAAAKKGKAENKETLKRLHLESPPSICAADATTCRSCVRANANQKRQTAIECGSNGDRVVGVIVDAVWGEVTKQPDFHYDVKPGSCAHDAIDKGAMPRVDVATTIKQLSDMCLGKERCVVDPKTEEFGAVPDVAEDAALALTVVAECVLVENYEESVARRDAAKNVVGCGVHGCNTCAIGGDLAAPVSGAASDDLVIACANSQVVADVVDARYVRRTGADAATRWNPVRDPGMCPDTFIPSDAASRCASTNHDAVLSVVKSRCVGRAKCVMSKDNVREAFAAQRGAECRDEPMEISVIAKCRKLPIPSQLVDAPMTRDAVGGIAMSSRPIPAATQRSVARYAASALHAIGVYAGSSVADDAGDGVAYGARGARETMTEVPFHGGSEPVAGGGAVHWLAGAMWLGDATAAEDARSPGSWRFKITNPGGAFWRRAGFFSVFGGEDASASPPKPAVELCLGLKCDLKACADANGGDACEVSVDIPAEANYRIQVFGLSEAAAAGKISVQFKPPPQCKFKSCRDAYDESTCELLDVDEMPWHDVARGLFPTFECEGPAAARVVSISAKTKPFCLRPSAYTTPADGSGDHKMKYCWPLSNKATRAEEGNSVGFGKDKCIGAYDLADKVSPRKNTVLAAKIDTDAVQRAEIHISPRSGRCRRSMALSSREKGSEDPGARLLMDLPFEPPESCAPLEAATDPTGTAATTSLACAPWTDAEDVSRRPSRDGAHRFVIDMDARTGKSPANAVPTPDRSAAFYYGDAHRGNWAHDFTRAHGEPGKSSVLLLSDGWHEMPSNSHFGGTSKKKPASVVMWMRRHPDVDVAPGGETIVSFQPTGMFEINDETGVLTRVVVGSKKKPTATDHSRVVLGVAPGNKLSFTAVAESGNVVCALLSPPVEALSEGGWHHVAFIMGVDEHDVKAGAKVTFYVDGQSVDAQCQSEKRGGFTFTDKTFGVKTRTTLLGAHFVVGDANGVLESRPRGGAFEGGFDGAIDDFGIYATQLSAEELRALSVDVPCARGFHGDGFVYFADMHESNAGDAGPSEGGASSAYAVELDGGCDAGLHTVSFRYLVSAGNNHELVVADAKGKRIGVVAFEEPMGVSSDDLTTWRYTTPLVFDGKDFKTNKLMLVELPEGTPTTTTPALGEVGATSTRPATATTSSSPPVIVDYFSRRFEGSGPLVDEISVGYGASYLQKAELENEGWRVAFRHVTRAEDGDENLARFCDVSGILSTNDIGESTLRCTSHGNVIVETTVLLTTAQPAKWEIRGENLGIDGRLEIVQNGQVVYHKDATKPKHVHARTNPAYVQSEKVTLHGTFTILLYGVYDDALATGWAPKLLFKEPRYCALFDFTPLDRGMLDCKLEERARAPAVDAESSNAASDADSAAAAHADDDALSDPNKVDENGNLKDPSADGLFMNLHVGANYGEDLELSDTNEAGFPFTFKLKGTFSLLGLKLALDIDIQPGPADTSDVTKGGGIHMMFNFEWRNPFNGDLLVRIAGNFDLTPMSFEKAIPEASLSGAKDAYQGLKDVRRVLYSGPHTTALAW